MNINHLSTRPLNFVKVAVMICLASSWANAATLAYWRFEDTAYLDDSSGGGHTLGVVGTSPSQVTPLPSSGNGSAFSNPIPNTSAPNTGLADFGTSLAGNFSVADDGWMDPIGANGTFTLEAFVNLGGSLPNSHNPWIVSQYEYTSVGERSFAFGINRDTGGLRAIIAGSTGGSDRTTFESSLDLAENTDYYVAMTYDSSNITFYIQDLTNGGVLQSQNIAHSQSLTGSSADVSVGGWDGVNGPDERWKGLIDEVRISDTVLSSSEFLVTVPEPSTYALLFGGLGLWIAIIRRRS